MFLVISHFFVKIPFFLVHTLRLDFGVFVITGPSTTTTTVVVNNCGGNDMFELGQCQTDMFSVTAPGNNAPPVICGQNSNEHSKFNKLLENWLHFSSCCFEKK